MNKSPMIISTRERSSAEKTSPKSVRNTSWIKHSLRLLQHESRRGELTIVFFAVVLAVATVFSLSGFSNHINNALERNSANFIAADKVLKSAREVPDEYFVKSTELGLNNAKQVLMNSMIFAGDNMELTTVKAVSSLYPLRGELLIQSSLLSKPKPMNSPEQGTAWVDKRLVEKLNITVGDTVEVGVKAFTVVGIINQIPDASFSVFTSGPTIIINAQDITATELIQPASRVTYKYLFSGDKQQIAAFSQWLLPQLNETQRWYDIKSTQSPLAKALERAEKYLSLASMLGIILAAVAVSVATRRYSERNQPIVATLKALGASMNHIRKLYILHWSLLSIISISVGILIGYGLMSLGLTAIANELPTENGSLSFYPFFVAILTGIISAIAFAVTPFSQLFSIRALAVIRGFNQNEHKKTLSLSSVVSLILPVSALFSLLLLFSQNLLLSVSLLAGGFIVALILALIAKVIISAGRSVGIKAGSAWHLAIANLKRRASQNVVQLISFTIAIKLLLLILVMKNSLLNDWQAQLPDQTANRFLINIAEHELSDVERFISSLNIQSSDLYPVVRGRVVAINDEKVNQDISKEKKKAADNGTTREGMGRELNLTWRNELPANNKLVDGQWWAENTQEKLVSVEQRLAQRLNLVIGDSITYTLGSDSFSAKVSSIRDVNWQSMQPNFYMIFSPTVLEGYTATYIASMFISQAHQKSFEQLLLAHPTVSVMDIDAMINQLRSVIDQVAIAIGFILVLVLIAGSLVLVAQVQASMEEREREIAILRTLGAKGRLLNNSVLFEFLALGAIAGFMASLAMESAVYILQAHIFDMSPSLHLEYWLLGTVSGAVFVSIVGFISCRRLLKLDSVTLIRRTL